MDYFEEIKKQKNFLIDLKEILKKHDVELCLDLFKKGSALSVCSKRVYNAMLINESYEDLIYLTANNIHHVIEGIN